MPLQICHSQSVATCTAERSDLLLAGKERTGIGCKANVWCANYQKGPGHQSLKGTDTLLLLVSHKRDVEFKKQMYHKQLTFASRRCHGWAHSKCSGFCMVYKASQLSMCFHLVCVFSRHRASKRRNDICPYAWLIHWGGRCHLTAPINAKGNVTIKGKVLNSQFMEEKGSGTLTTVYDVSVPYTIGYRRK